MHKICDKTRLFRAVFAFALALAMVLPMLPAIPAQAADTEGQYEVSDYKPDYDSSTWTYPEVEGKVFAGWYTDATYSTPYTKLTGTAYAKFVDESLMVLKRQLNTGAALSDEKVNIRFITAIDSLDFNSVIFNVQIPGQGKSWKWSEKTAYTSLLENGTQIATPSALYGAEAKYFVLHSLSNIPQSVFYEDFNVNIYWVTLDGTTVESDLFTFTLAEIITKSANQNRLWSVNDLSNGMTVGGIETDQNDGRDQTVGKVTAYRGMIATNGEKTNAFAYRTTSIVSGNNNAQAETVTIDSAAMEAIGFDNSRAVKATDDIFWVWVHSYRDSDQRLQLEINGMVLYAQDGYIYTIEEDSQGKPQMVQITSEESIDDTDIRAGVALMPHSDYSRIKIEAGWSGWIGLPLQFFKNTTEGTTIAAGDTIEKLSFIMGWRSAVDEGNANAVRTTGNIYFDEFWLTGAGKMPALSDEQLLYTAPMQVELWSLDETSGDVTGVTYQDTAYNASSFYKDYSHGLNGTNALTLSLADFTETSGSTAQRWNRIRFNDATALKNNSFNTSATLKASDDILWFWVNCQTSITMRWEIYINGYTIKGEDVSDGIPSETIYIYTIQPNAQTGTPEMVKIYHDVCTAQTSTIALVNQGAGNKNDTSQLKIAPGFSGWIGFPANMFKTNIAAGSSISKIMVFPRYANVDAVPAGQVAGGELYFDSFWLTSGGTMPNLSNEQLLYTAPYQNSLWNVDSATEGLLGTATTNDRDTVTGSVAANKGVLNNVSEKTQAFVYKVREITETAGTTQANAVSLSTSQLSGAGFDTSCKLNATDDVLWFWVDSHLTTTQRLELRLNGRVFAQSDANGQEAYVYTIIAGSNNDPVKVKVPLEIGTYVSDTRSGLALMPHSSWTRLKIESGFTGWIGLPMNFFVNPDDAADVFEIGDTITKMNFVMGWTANKTGYTDPAFTNTNRAAGTVFFDEFWLTDNGSVPALSDSQLTPYTASAQQLWHFDDSSEAIASESITKNDNRNDVVATRGMGFGLNDSNALGYMLMEVLETTATAQQSETVNFNSASALSKNGFNTTAKLTNDQDIIWFWMDAQTSIPMRLQISINDAQLGGGTVTAGSTNPSFYIYTIVENASGKPEMSKIEHTVCNTDVSTSGIALVNQGTGNANPTSQILVYPGWSGWIGIPANVLTSGGAIGAGDTINQFSVLARMYATDGAVSDQKVGDVIYFDEFWLTSPLTMPALSNAELLYKADHTPHDADDYLADSSLFVPTWSVPTSSYYFEVPAAMLNFTEKYNSFMDPDGRLMSVAHRGDRNTFYPENSLESYMSVIAMGADMAEVDITKTKDGVLVCVHVGTADENGDINDLSRTNVEILRARGVSLPESNDVSDWTYAQLQQLRLVKSSTTTMAVVTNYTIPTLEDVIKVCKNRIFLTLDKTSEFEWSEVLTLIKAQQAYLTVLVPYNYSGSYYAESYAPGLVDNLTSLAGKQAPYMTEWYTAESAYISSSLARAKRIISTYGMPKVLRSGEYDVSGGMDSYYSQLKDTYRLYAETLEDSSETVDVWSAMQSKGINLIMTDYKLLDLVRYIAQTEFSQ